MHLPIYTSKQTARREGLVISAPNRHAALPGFAIASLAKALATASLFCVVAVLVCAAFVKARATCGLFCDIDTRYNEVSCSHEGVNPFSVWNQEVVHERYQGLERPDKPEERSPGKAKVHAYPPWHTTFFWWYPWLPRGLVCWGMFVFNIIAFLAVGAYFAKRLPLESPWDKALFGLCGILPCAYVWGSHLATGNYPILVLVLFLLMIALLRRGHDMAAGLCWALMMTKPQMSALAFWPLLLAGKFKTIATAVAVVGAATLVPALVYGESPVELVAQIPRIGAPYMRNGVSSGLVAAFGLSGLASYEKFQLVVAFVGFLACGALSIVFARSRSWIVRFVPVMLIMPVWTYALPQDRTFLVCLSFTLGLVGYCYAERRWGRQKAKPALYTAMAAETVVVTAFPAFASLGLLFGFLDKDVVSLVYRTWQSVLYVLACAGCACLAFNVRETDDLLP